MSSPRAAVTRSQIVERGSWHGRCSLCLHLEALGSLGLGPVYQPLVLQFILRTYTHRVVHRLMESNRQHAWIVDTSIVLWNRCPWSSVLVLENLSACLCAADANMLSLCAQQDHFLSRPFFVLFSVDSHIYLLMLIEFVFCVLSEPDNYAIWSGFFRPAICSAYRGDNQCLLQAELALGSTGLLTRSERVFRPM